MDVNQLRQAATDAAELARTLGRLADEAESNSPRAEVPRDLVAALARLSPAHRAALVRVASGGELDEDRRGSEHLWMPIDSAVVEGATTDRGRKRIMTTIGSADSALGGVGWGEDADGDVWAKVPAATAAAVRRIVADEANSTDLFGLDLDSMNAEADQ